MSQVWSAPALGFKSTEVTSQPISRKALPTLPVPLKSSSKWGISMGRDLGGGGRKDQVKNQGEVQTACLNFYLVQPRWKTREMGRQAVLSFTWFLRPCEEPGRWEDIVSAHLLGS